MIKIVYRNINEEGPVSNLLTQEDRDFSYVYPYLYKMIDYPVAALDDIDCTRDPFLYELPWNTLRFLDNFYNNLDPRVIEGVKNYKGYFVLNDSVDPTYEINLKEWAEFLQSKGISPRKLIYLSGCFDVDDARTYGISLVASEWNEATHAYLFSKNFSENDQLTLHKFKRFLSLNRTWHHHRLQFMYELYKNDLLKDFDISFLDRDINSGELFSDALFTKSLGFYPESETANIEKLGKEIDKILPLQVDNIFELGGTHVSHSHINNSSRYYYNVVTETTFYNFYGNDFSGIHLSEKILKPVLYRTPFILVGPYKGLEVMRKLGYKTFSEFIDESYDDIEDSYQRMQAVIKVIKDISNTSEAKLAEIDILCRDICEHNFQTLAERGRTSKERLARTLKKIVYSIR